MPIPQSFIEKLKYACDLESVMSSYVEFKREGRNKKCLCPFHSEKTPSLVLYPENQSFYCFGCGAGGDVITFIRLIENLDYPSAVRFLAQKAGLPMPEEEKDTDLSARKSRILEMNREAARFFHQYLLSEQGKAGRAYLASRRLTRKTVTTYGLGYAPDGWSALRDHLRQKGYRYEEMEEAGLVAKSKKGDSYYDYFRNRVIFPIIDLRGSVVGFGGRVLDDSKPKYLNTKDTPVFQKSHILFSLNLAKKDTSRRLILCEGNIDVITLYQAGFPNAVATCGTALTEEQARLIAQYADEVVIAYDSDAAGQKALSRALQIFSRVTVTPRVLSMEGAKDPDEYINKFGLEQFKRLVDGAEQASDHALNNAVIGCDLDTDEGRLAYLNRALPILSGIPNAIEREVYAGRVSKQTGVLKETILSQAAALSRRERNRAKRREWQTVQSGRAQYRDPLDPKRGEHLREARAEEEILRYLLAFPEEIGSVAASLAPEDFVTDFHRRVYEVLLSAPAEHAADLSQMSAQFTPQEMGRIAGILARGNGVSQSKKQCDDCITVLRQYRGKKTPDEIAKMSPQELAEYFKKQQELKRKKTDH